MRTSNSLIAVAMVVLCPVLTFAGTISGKVTYTGTPVKQKPISMAKEPSCDKQHATPITTETIVTGANNSLENVVVYISAGADEAAAPAQAVTFTQKGCQYIPHVIALHTGQELHVVNGDQTSHNIHPMPKSNPEWNKSQPPGAPPIVQKFDNAEFISVKCQIHPWMHGWFAVLKTNHYAISGDGGSFSLPNLPPGKYTVTAWHEDYGTQTQEVTITGNETKSIDFSFKAKAF